jgi:signal peptide peptidase SppA
MKKKISEYILAHQWAILPESLEQIVAISEREHEYAGNLEALEQKMGRPLDNTHEAVIRDGVAVISAAGPMMRYGNIFARISGATSYDILAQDIRSALDNPAVKAILLNIDSPGGEVNGASELASQVRAAREIKPVYAYIGGTGASAGYWLASAADKIFASDTAIIGSIGVQMAFTVRGESPNSKSYRFVSSQSQLKNASPETEVGAKEIQRVVDSLAQVFVQAVADNRGVSLDKVLADFGQGAVFVGSDALNRGMIDGISTFEGVLQQLAQGPSASGTSVRMIAMDIKTMTSAQLAEARPDLVAQIEEGAKAKAEAEFEPKISAAKSEGAKAERERVAGIEALAVPGHEALIASLKADENMTASQASMKIIAAIQAGGTAPAPVATTEKPKGESALDALKNAEANLNAPAPTAETKPGTPDAEKFNPNAVLELARQNGMSV